MSAHDESRYVRLDDIEALIAAGLGNTDILAREDGRPEGWGAGWYSALDGLRQNLHAVSRPADMTPALRALKDLVEYCKGAQSDPEVFQEEARLIAAGETAIRMAEGGPPADAETAWPIEAAPRDGTMVRLLVEFETGSDKPWLPLDDAAQSWTIGFNNLENTEEDVWQFVGWNWSQDCFEDCHAPEHGEIIGWAPFEGGEVRP